MSKETEELDRLEKAWHEAVRGVTIVQDALTRAEANEARVKIEYQAYMRKLSAQLDSTNKSVGGPE